MRRKRLRKKCNFNPLPPHGGRLRIFRISLKSKTFQSTPSAWRETAVGVFLFAAVDISIHSLRMEGDVYGAAMEQMVVHFNPLPPHGGRLSPPLPLRYRKGQFQSTPSAWRETGGYKAASAGKKLFQSTPSAWRETCSKLLMWRRRQDFNPLPPHGGRLSMRMIRYSDFKFQSTPSAWRETIQFWQGIRHFRISIHSLRMEGDFFGSTLLEKRYKFQSTPSAWRETWLLVGHHKGTGNFNPLPPHGGRLRQCWLSTIGELFQSTPSAWRETSRSCVIGIRTDLFQSTPSAWRETQ